MGAYSGIGLGLRGAGSLTTAPHIGKATAPSYNANAQAYFDAVEIFDATAFDLSSYNATYTTEYVKDVHNNLFNSLDSIWSNIGQFIILCGKKDAVGVPAKGATMTLVNYSSSNFNPVQTGSGSSGKIGLKSGSGQYLTLPNNTPPLNLQVVPSANKDDISFIQVVTNGAGNYDSGFDYFENSGNAGYFETNQKYDTVQYFYGKTYTNSISASTSFATEAYWVYANYQGTAYIAKNGGSPSASTSGVTTTYTGIGAGGSGGQNFRFTGGGNSGRFPLLMSYKNGAPSGTIKSAFKTFLEAFGDSTIP
jgi:hypothetical protein